MVDISVDRVKEDDTITNEVKVMKVKATQVQV